MQLVVSTPQKAILLPSKQTYFQNLLAKDHPPTVKATHGTALQEMAVCWGKWGPTWVGFYLGVSFLETDFKVVLGKVKPSILEPTLQIRMGPNIDCWGSCPTGASAGISSVSSLFPLFVLGGGGSGSLKKHSKNHLLKTRRDMEV